MNISGCSSELRDKVKMKKKRKNTQSKFRRNLKGFWATYVQTKKFNCKVSSVINGNKNMLE